MADASWRILLTAIVVLAAFRTGHAQYNETTRLPPRSPSPMPMLARPTVISPANNSLSMYSSPEGSHEFVGPPPSDDWCVPPQSPCRTSSWTAAVEMIPSETLLTDSPFGRWNDNDAFALRFILGYEDPSGYGIRARVWGLGQEVSPPADDVTLSMGSFNLDLYKRVFLDGAEVAFGGGPASGGLEFELSDNTHSRFEGGGVSMFLDGFYGIHDFEKAQLGAVARARYSLLMGDWRDTTGGGVVSNTDNDTMSVAELAWGLEYRRRFGPCEDHNWFAGLLFEFQRWQSDWMSSAADTSIGVSGINVYTGLNW
jgi:hypothetical protein